MVPPVSWACTQASPAAIESWTSLTLSGLSSAASLADSPVLIFSQTRGTPKNAVGCTSPRAPSSSAGSPMAWMWLPWSCGM